MPTQAISLLITFTFVIPSRFTLLSFIYKYWSWKWVGRPLSTFRSKSHKKNSSIYLLFIILLFDVFFLLLLFLSQQSLAEVANISHDIFFFPQFSDCSFRVKIVHSKSSSSAIPIFLRYLNIVSVLFILKSFHICTPKPYVQDSFTWLIDFR